MRTGRFCFLFLLALLAVLMMDSHFHSTRAQTTYLCPDGTTNCYQTNYAHLTDLQRQGRDTWYFWTGGDRDPSGANIVGDQALWRHIAVETHGQFDAYGLWVDDCSSVNTPSLGDACGKSAGVIGLLPNPKFKQSELLWPASFTTLRAGQSAFRKGRRYS
jgi:hypothetical protein